MFCQKVNPVAGQDTHSDLFSLFEFEVYRFQRKCAIGKLKTNWYYEKIWWFLTQSADPGQFRKLCAAVVLSQDIFLMKRTVFMLVISVMIFALNYVGVSLCIIFFSWWLKLKAFLLLLFLCSALQKTRSVFSCTYLKMNLTMGLMREKLPPN